MNKSSAPLSGIRAIELAQNFAGPFAGQILAHLGAEVIKVERPNGGDDCRDWGQARFGDASPSYHAVNIAKRSIAVDFQDADQRDWLIELIGTADVVLQNLRPGSLTPFGLDAEALRARYPALIYANVSAFGPVGPLRDQPGYEPMMQAFAGLMLVSGDEGDPPVRIGTQVLDNGTGMWAALGIIAALWQRQASGEGSTIDASLFETGLGWQTIRYANYSGTGTVPPRHRTGSRGVVPFQAFECADGPLVVAVANDRLFRRLMTVVGRPEWADDPRFLTNGDRVKHQGELIPPLEEMFARRPRADWIADLNAVGVPVAPVQSLDEVAAHPQTAATGMIQRPPGGPLDLMSLPLKFDGVRPTPRAASPALGAANAELGVPEPAAPAAPARSAAGDD